MQSKTERALQRVANGTSPYAAAKAEGIAQSTIYRAVKRQAAAPEMPNAGYAYKVGGLVAAIQVRNKVELPQKLLLGLADEPHGASYLFRLHSLTHLLSSVELPDVPPGYTPSERVTADFWRGFKGFVDRRVGCGDRRVAMAKAVPPRVEDDGDEADNTPI